MPTANGPFLIRAARVLSVILTAVWAAVLMSTPGRANDGVAEVGAGGLEFTTNAFVEMAEEDLRISLDRIDVRYVFRNTDAEPQTLLVAFPLPALAADWFGDDADKRLATADPLKYIDFSTKVDGAPLTTQVEMRARVLSVDVTEELKAAGLPLFPGSAELKPKLAAMPGATLEALSARGAVERFGGEIFPRWQYGVTYYWRQTFPPGKDVVIEHSYKPLSGGSVPYDKFLDDFSGTYCIGSEFRATYDKTKGQTGGPGFAWVNYILATAGTWAGPIGKFKLTVEKPSPDWTVAFCRDGVKATSPTTLEWTAENYRPGDDLDILFLGK
jgi:Domain of unknown function (DUF4424)